MLNEALGSISRLKTHTQYWCPARWPSGRRVVFDKRKSFCPLGVFGSPGHRGLGEVIRPEMADTLTTKQTLVNGRNNGVSPFSLAYVRTV